MHEKAVLERIRALHTDDDFDEESYVSVHHEKPLRDMAFEREPEGLAVSTLESWQSKLLQDPKNRSVNIHPSSMPPSPPSKIYVRVLVHSGG